MSLFDIYKEGAAEREHEIAVTLSAEAWESVVYALEKVSMEASSKSTTIIKPSAMLADLMACRQQILAYFASEIGYPPSPTLAASSVGKKDDPPTDKQPRRTNGGSWGENTEPWSPAGR